ncbi:MAG: tetratricopeptide repeat protein [bacterium]
MAEVDIKKKATELLQRGRYDDAVAEYRAFLDNSRKKNPAVLNLIGDIYAKQGGFEKAFESYLEAARLYSEEGLFHNGIAVGKKVLRMDREQTEVYGMLGVLYARQGLGGDCVKFLKEFARRKEGEGEFPAALAAFAEACDILKEFPEVHVEYGEMLEKVDRSEDAAASYRAAARIWADRGIEDRATEWTRRAAQLAGASAIEAGANMKDIMSLRTLDDSPASNVAPAGQSDARDRFWGRTDEPEGLTLETSISMPVPQAADGSKPWAPYDPAAHPGLPPPPPLPPRRGAPRPAAKPSLLFAEPAGISASVTAQPPPVPATQPPPVPSSIDLHLDLPADAPAAEAPAVDFAALPGVVMPPHGTPPPVPAAGEAPRSKADDDLAAFFEATAASAPEQAVVIGDDFELVREGGDVSEVIADFRAATLEILDLDDHQSHYDLGTTYMEMELFDEAAAEFEIAARGPEFALPSQEMLGYCFLRKGQIELAIRELEKGLALPIGDDRGKLGLLYNLGIACSVLDRDQEAITHFQRILEVDPDFRDTQTRLERLVAAP